MEGFVTLIIGASSFLGANLVPYLRDRHYDVVSVSTHKNESIPYDKLSEFKCVIYLKPDADERLNDCPVPLLAIGSGALVDFNAGRINPNAYIEGKRKIVRMSSCTIHPGFFIPHPDHLDTGRGLHRDTLVTLFGGAPIPDTFSLDKAYYMTPVEALCIVIAKFIHNPHKYTGEFALGTPMTVSRRELRYKAPFANSPRIYEKEMQRTANIFGCVVNETPEQLGRDAEAWVQKIIKE
jgi:hypothetical protein